MGGKYDPDNDSCGTCIFWDRMDDEGTACCRRYPPTILPSESQDVGWVDLSPLLFRDNWCGEFVSREEGRQVP